MAQAARQTRTAARSKMADLPKAKPAIIRALGKAIEQYDEAFSARSKRATNEAFQQVEALIGKYVDRSKLGPGEALAELLDAVEAKPLGTIPKWGQPGRFLLTYKDVPLDIHYGGLIQPSRIFARAVNLDQPFFTPTGVLDLRFEAIEQKGENPSIWILNLIAKNVAATDGNLVPIDENLIAELKQPGDPAWQPGGFYTMLDRKTDPAWQPDGFLDQQTEGRYRETLGFAIAGSEREAQFDQRKEDLADQVHALHGGGGGNEGGGEEYGGDTLNAAESSRGEPFRSKLVNRNFAPGAQDMRRRLETVLENHGIQAAARTMVIDDFLSALEDPTWSMIEAALGIEAPASTILGKVSAKVNAETIAQAWRNMIRCILLGYGGEVELPGDQVAGSEDRRMPHYGQGAYRTKLDAPREAVHA